MACLQLVAQVLKARNAKLFPGLSDSIAPTTSSIERPDQHDVDTISQRGGASRFSMPSTTSLMCSGRLFNPGRR
jgi:hypothetical protein